MFRFNALQFSRMCVRVCEPHAKKEESVCVVWKILVIICCCYFDCFPTVWYSWARQLISSDSIFPPQQQTDIEPDHTNCGGDQQQQQQQSSQTQQFNSVATKWALVQLWTSSETDESFENRKSLCEFLRSGRVHVVHCMTIIDEIIERKLAHVCSFCFIIC